MDEKSMLDVMRDILRVISDKYPKWTDVQTGRFVRRTITEDISQEKLVKEIEEVSMNEEVGELLKAYRAVKNELLRKVREKASGMELESSPEVIGRNAEEWAYFLILSGEK